MFIDHHEIDVKTQFTSYYALTDIQCFIQRHLVDWNNLKILLQKADKMLNICFGMIFV